MPTRYYEWDELEDNIIAEYDENGNVIVEYTTEPGYHGAVISEHRNGQTYYHHHDGQGNTIALTNDQGEVTDTFAYTANGELTERTGNTPTPYQYKGEHGYYTDQETGEVMMRRRKLDPEQGRWLSADPAGLLDDVNRYRYVQNNPIGLIDPSGLEAFDCEKGRKHIKCAEIRHPPFVPPPPRERIGIPRPVPVVHLPCGKGCELVINQVPRIDESGNISVTQVPICLCCLPIFVRGEICKSGRCAVCSLTRPKILKEGRRWITAYETVHQCTCVESPLDPFLECGGTTSPNPPE
ncbi:MAG TPA: RHS repeat-associated core domain-containing protein [Pirellulaceae bacterium]|nr:RHS repeat-associated core domain-containing protein [Pirellulaceae bacterium]